MKTLQNNLTTPEQSKRLLELGVPADSADCYWNDICGKPIPMQQGILYSDKRNQFRKVNVPVWSVGRLIEIFIICTPYVEIILRTRLIEQLIASYENVIKQGLMDFSKLEE